MIGHALWIKGLFTDPHSLSESFGIPENQIFEVMGLAHEDPNHLALIQVRYGEFVSGPSAQPVVLYYPDNDELRDFATCTAVSNHNLVIDFLLTHTTDLVVTLRCPAWQSHLLDP